MSRQATDFSARIVYADLDGTLLNDQHRISDYTRSVLKNLRARRDVYFVVVTGRPYAAVKNILRESSIEADFVVTSNGAEVHDGQGKLVFNHFIPPSIVQRLLNIKVDVGADPCDLSQLQTAVSKNLFQSDRWYINRPTIKTYSAYSADFQPIFDASLCQRDLTELAGVHTMFFNGPHDLLLPIEHILQTDLAQEVQHVFSFPHLLEVSASHVNKGTAVTEIAKLLKVVLPNTIAFGDGLNDIPMLSVVGTRYIMANAPSNVVEAIDFPFTPIGSNVDDGVARELERLFC